MTLLRVNRAALAIVGVTLILAPIAPTISGADSPSLAGSQGVDPVPPPTASQVTVHGRGPYSGVSVTVNQTQNLVNQTIGVTWSGAPKTTTANVNYFAGTFDANFMAVFECWGDPSPTDPLTPINPGPLPQQCEFGGDAVDGAAAYPDGGLTDPGSASRVLAVSSSDPNYAHYQAAGGVPDPSQGGVLFEPFEAVDGTVVNFSENVAGHTDPSVSFWLNPYFSYNDTNEIAYGRTYPDGTGNQLFVADTGLEAPGLGCGQKIQPVPGGGTKIPQCWLVVVPQPSIATSPLTPDNWANRISIPLNFQTVDSPCNFGQSERRVAGGELSRAAMSSWQPILCSQQGGTPFSYTPLGDTLARTQLPSAGANDAQIAEVTDPLPPSATVTGNPPVYAPLTLSGLVIAFNIERKPASDPKTSEPYVSELPFATTRVKTIRLTPRLVAKLLTESYVNEMPGLGSSGIAKIPWITHNPDNLFTDPDFEQFNPEFSLLLASNGANAAQLLTEFNQADATAALWEWIAADPEASAWLAGVPDPWGMLVNPAYSTTPYVNPAGVGFNLQGLDTFPKNSQYCLAPQEPSVLGQPVPPACILNWSPYAQSMQRVAQDTLTTNIGSHSHDLGNTAPSAEQYWGADGAEPVGYRVVLSVTDSASAAAYGLQTALLSQAGDDSASRTFIAADIPGINAGEKSMVSASGVPGILVPNPATSAPGAYPLSLLTYAVTLPQALDASARKDFARLVDYAVGPGQVQGTAFGQLPPGYVPLPNDLRQAALQAVKQVTSVPTQSPAGTGTSALPASTATPTAGALALGSSLAGTTPPVSPSTTFPAVITLPAPAARSDQRASLAGLRTPNTKAGTMRFLIIIALGIFIAAALATLVGYFPRLRKLLRRAGTKH